MHVILLRPSGPSSEALKRSLYAVLLNPLGDQLSATGLLRCCSTFEGSTFRTSLFFLSTISCVPLQVPFVVPIVVPFGNIRARS